MDTPDKLSVLMVDCGAGVRSLAGEALIEAGFELVGAESERLGLQDALDLAGRREVDVVVMGSEEKDVQRILTVARQLLLEGGPVAVVHLMSADEVERISEVLGNDLGECVLVPFSKEQLAVSVQAAVARRLRVMEAKLPELGVMEVLDGLDEGLLVADFAGRVKWVNRAATLMLGMEGNELLGRDLSSVYQVNLPDGGEVKSFSAATGVPRLLSLKNKLGEVGLIEDRCSVLHDAMGEVQGVAILFRRLSKVEAAAKERDSNLVDSVTDPLLAVDAEWKIVFANGAAARWLGAVGENLRGRWWWELLPESAREMHEAAFVKAWERREALGAEIFMEGSGAWYEVRSYPHGDGRLMWMKDITTRKLEWERGNRLDRLESLGLLARGFAHDFNNLLTVLLGNLSLAEHRLGAGGPVMEIQSARQATLLAQGLVQQLLTFARGGAPVKRAIALADLVKHFFEQHPKVVGIEYGIEVQEGLPSMALDPNQIRRLLGNLVRNAEQATSRGGRIVVKCEAADPSSMFGHDVLKDAPESLAGMVLEVEDNGEGIEAQNLPHIFEPYFTTRKKQNATGLGLTVCESIARAHGGTINVYAVKPRGTRVRFFLPVEEDAAGNDGEPEMLEMKGPGPGRTPRILVLEDDHLVRALICRGLQSQGYEVTETVDGLETVRLYEQSMKEGRAFDVVILDLSIPNGMGGVRTMEKLRALDPQVLALVSSGYSDDPAMAQPSAYGFAAVLPKPYEPLELIHVVQRLLDERMKSGR